MSNIVFNIALGRVAEFYNRVRTNDPANSALVMVVLAATGLEADAVLKDKDTLADVLSGTTNEVTNTGYARKVLTDTVLTNLTPDDTLDLVALSVPNQTWTTVAVGDDWGAIVICYDNDTTSGTDANLIPLTKHDFVITPDGSDIVAQVSATGFYRAA